ncbi:MAG: endonuclease/exonuclease/phosphatase family protein [Sphingobacteriaceae bacterium]
MNSFKKINLFLSLLFTFQFLLAQDTLKFMSYNVLNFNSSEPTKSRYLDIKTILQNADPDVVMLCELSNAGAPQFLLDSAFNAAGIGTFTRAAFYDGTDTDNMLFYKTNKIKLRSQKQITTSLRDISQYLVYKVVAPNDTAFIYLHMSHLKAGSLTADEFQRLSEVTAFCTDIATIPQGANIIFAGDLNFKSSIEASYTTLTSANCSHVFSDPINMPGLWNNTSTFKHIHTQSTRTSSFPGCCGGATGGMDDRFDFMLVTSPLMNGNNKVTYVPGSYKAFGNDGQHMNKAITEAPTNSVVPAIVTQALFNVSDHLPVIMKMAFRPSEVAIKKNSQNNNNFKIWAVANAGSNYLAVTTNKTDTYKLKIVDMAGKIIYDQSIELKEGYQTIELANMNLKNAIYQAILKNETDVSRCLLPINTPN